MLNKDLYRCRRLNILSFHTTTLTYVLQRVSRKLVNHINKIARTFSRYNVLSRDDFHPEKE